MVGAADPVGLTRLARGLVDLRDRTGGVPVRVVVNRMRGSIGWSEKDIAGMVEGFSRVAGLHFLPEDRAATDRALVTGRPLAELRRLLARARPGRAHRRGLPGHRAPAHGRRVAAAAGPRLKFWFSSRIR